MHHPGRGQREGDLYSILGVSRDAPRQEIVRAYHRAAHAAHPDRQPGDPGAGPRFRALTEAYDVLSDPARRARYDNAQPGPGQRARGPASHRTATGGRQSDSRPAPLKEGIPGWVPPPGGVPLWAGPVHVDPPSGPVASGPHGDPVTPAELAFLLRRYLGGWWWRA
jgi:curved DNA-binding protein CbpA